MLSRHLENVILLLAHDLQTFELGNFDGLEDVFKNFIERMSVNGGRRLGALVIFSDQLLHIGHVVIEIPFLLEKPLDHFVFLSAANRIVR